MLEHVPRDAKVFTEPFFANAWNSPWPQAISSPRLLLGGERAYARYLSDRLVRAYMRPRLLLGRRQLQLLGPGPLRPS